MDRRVAAVLVGGLVWLGLLTLGTPGDEEAAAPPADPWATTLEPIAAPVLLPNMRSVGARDIHIQEAGRTRRLRFAAALANLGPGPLVLLPRGRGDCPPGQHGAVQVVHVDVDQDGRYKGWRDTARTRQFSGCMLRHRGHDHWHFDAMAAYSLRRPGAQRPVVSRDKVSFCLRDNERVPDLPVVVRRQHFGDCKADTGQGISPGWVDVYSADLDGQWLRLPRGVDREVVCLELAADPLDLVEESGEADNATSVALRIRGSTVRRVPPRPCRA